MVPGNVTVEDAVEERSVEDELAVVASEASDDVDAESVVDIEVEIVVDGCSISEELAEVDAPLVAETLELTLALRKSDVEPEAEIEAEVEADPDAETDADPEAVTETEPEAVMEAPGPVDADSRRQTTDPASSSTSTISL